MASRIRFDGGKLVSNLKTIDTRMQAFIFVSCQLHARRGETYAKRNAPWTDRTTNARNGLVGRAYRGGSSFAVVIAGTVPYQPFLELRWNGRYAIIRPTIAHTGPELMTTLSTGFSRVFGRN